MRASVLSVALFAVATLGSSISSIEKGLRVPGCDVSRAKLPQASPNSTALVVPAASVAKPKFIGLGVGVQNYTCDATTGKFVTAGAVATLYDISCLEKTSLFSSALQDVAFELEQDHPVLERVIEAIAQKSCLKLGDHFFVTSPSGSGISPRFDFTKTLRNKNAFFLGARAAGEPAPVTAQDVDWLELSNVQGGLAKFVFRVRTKGGQPATSCTAGQSSSMPYAAQYWFFA